MVRQVLVKKQYKDQVWFVVEEISYERTPRTTGLYPTGLIGRRSTEGNSGSEEGISFDRLQHPK